MPHLNVQHPREIFYYTIPMLVWRPRTYRVRWTWDLMCM